MANQSLDWGKVNLESMKGQKWNTFNRSYEELARNKDDVNNDVYGSKKNSSNGIISNLNKSDTMKLKQEDMYLFGHCPAWDQFYLVVCEYCRQVIKPQALARHIELRHGSASSENITDTLHPSKTYEAPVNTLTSNCVQKSPENSISTAKSVVSKDVSSNSSPKTKVSVITTPPGPGPGGGLTAAENAVIVDTPSQETESSLQSKKTSKKQLKQGKLLPCKDREYDANKHCGVRLSESDKPCTRSLTCKTHSLTLRRNVPGRTKTFDELLAEHRAAKEAALKAAGLEVKPTKQQLRQREQEAKRQLLKQQQLQQQQLLLQQQKQQLQVPRLQQLTNSQVQQPDLSSKQPQTHQREQIQSHKGHPLLRFDDSRPIKQNVQVHKLTPLKPHSSEELSPQAPVIGQDGNFYLSKHPRPHAVCSFNFCQLPFKSKKSSSPSFGLRKQMSFSALDQLFRLSTASSRPKTTVLTSSSSSSSTTTMLLPSLLKGTSPVNKKCKLEPSEIREQPLCSEVSSLSANSAGPTSLLSQSYTTLKAKSCKKKSKIVLNNGDAAECSSPSSLSSISSPPTPVGKSNLTKNNSSSPTSSLVTSQVPHKTLNELLSNSSDCGSKSILINGNHFSNSTFHVTAKTNVKHFNSMLKLPSSLSFTPSTFPNSAQPSELMQPKGLMKSKHQQRLKSPSHKFLPAKDNS